MATNDIRFKRMKQEYLSLHDAQDNLMDKVDTFEGAVLGLTQVVEANRTMLLENREMMLENREMLLENREMMLENRAMLLAIIKHLDVPYVKPPIGFSRD